MSKELTIDEIMDRLSRICYKRDCCVRTRPDFLPGPMKWYVSLSNIVVGNIEAGGACSSITQNCDSGSNPEEAIRNVWQGVLNLAKSNKVALMRFNCPSDVPVPGDEPQVWIRWNVELDDWEDVPVRRLSSDKLRAYRDQIWRDKIC